MARKQQFTLEFPINCSVSVLYSMVATSSGLSEWFADKVDAKDNFLHFYWDGSSEVAEVLKEIENVCVQYRWDWMAENEYFEFRIATSPITNEIILHITDYADKADLDDQKTLWESQIQELKHRVGD